MVGLMASMLGISLLAANPHGNLVDETKFAEVLTKHVVESRIDYASLKKDRAALDEYLKAVGAVTNADYDKASKEAQVAYLLNAYNAYTIESILDNYPIKGGFFGGANSIKGISGVWDKKKHKTAIGSVTLDEIEHKNVRTKFDMPATHMGLVCASKGCPPLRREPYWADGLAAQLADQGKIYLASKYGLDADGGVKVSTIFKWFGDDFKKAGGWKSWVVAHAPDAKKDAVKKALDADTFGYIDYDWSLNDRKGGS